MDYNPGLKVKGVMCYELLSETYERGFGCCRSASGK